MTTPMGPTQEAMRRRARLMKMANVPMKVFLGLPVATPLSRQLMMVTHIGRRTGRHYHQPVSYIRHGDTLLTPGGGRWTRNLSEGQPVELRLAGRRVSARPELVADPGEVERLLGIMVQRNPRLASFVPFVAGDGGIDTAMLRRAVDSGFRVVRWHLSGNRS